MILNSMFGEIFLIYSVIPQHVVPSAPTTTGIVSILLRFQHFWISISKSRYLTIFSATFLTTLRHTGTATSIIRHVFFFVSCIVISGRLHLTFLSVGILTSHIIIWSPVDTVSAGMCLVHVLLTFTPRSLSIHQCKYFAIWLCRNVYWLLASILHPETIWCTVSFCSLHSLHFVSFPLPQIFDAMYLVANACSCAAHNKLSVSNRRCDCSSHCSDLGTSMLAASDLYLK